MFGDFLAQGGATTDSSLTGSLSQLPYVATMSISTALKYYWAKTFPSKVYSYITGV